ncbi:hypothetical protein ACET3Z_022159 [Daucus carota]
MLKPIASLESRDAEKVDALKALDAEKEHCIRTAEDDRSTIEKLQLEILSLTQNSRTFIEIDFLSESLDKTRSLKKAEIEEKENIGTALKMEIKNLQEKMVDQEEYLLQMQQKASSKQQ